MIVNTVYLLKTMKKCFLKIPLEFTLHTVVYLEHIRKEKYAERDNMKLFSFGEIIWDVFPDGKALGGAPLNFAAHAALQGAEVWLGSAVGEDELGTDAIEKIKKLGVKTEYVSKISDKPTGRCDVALDENKIPRYEILTDTAYDRISLPHKLEEKFDVISFGTLALRGKENRDTLKRVLENNTFKTVFTDLNIRAPFYSKESIVFCLENASIVKVSDEELPVVTDILYGKSLETVCAVSRIAEDYRNIELIVVTQGEKGAFCYERKSGEIYRASAVPVNAVSTVGAGDSFGATFLTEYHKHGDILSSMELAAKVSAYVVSQKGALPEGMKQFIENLFNLQ